MSVLLNIGEAILLVAVALIDGVFLVETLGGLVRHRETLPLTTIVPTIALLIPAHNEAEALAAARADYAALAGGTIRIVLVADNCTDATAEVARDLGFDVAERNDQGRRGKGYALAFGRDRMSAAPPEVAIILDADCVTDRASIERLAVAALRSGGPVQATYLFHPAPAAPPAVQISNFAFAVKNLVRQRGLRRIGAAAVLTGSGMAFPWPLFSRLDLATGNVVEDLALGIDLIRDGHPPMFVEGATVWSASSGTEGTQTQRSRWEGGFLATARRYAPGLVRSGIVRRDWQSFWMGCHLMVPPLSLLIAINLLIALLVAVPTALGFGMWPLAAAALLLAALVLSVGLAWAVEGRRHVSGGVLLRLPLYFVWKIALYVRIVTGRQTVAWTRTDRVDH